MPFRVIAFVLTLVLLCSGFSVPGQAMADSAQNAEQAHDLTLADDHPDGSIDDDRSDDLPAQPQAESAQDPFMLAASCSPVDPMLTLARPHRLGLAARQPPFLEGPQRPPSSAVISA